MNQVKTNKWSLYQDSDLWIYSFPITEIDKRGLGYRDLLKAFITACHTIILVEFTN